MFRRLFFVVALIGALAAPVPSSVAAPQKKSTTTKSQKKAEKGSEKSETKAQKKSEKSDEKAEKKESKAEGTPPKGATAQCKDGTYSFSQHRSGTCSHHGGVKTWISPPAK